MGETICPPDVDKEIYNTLFKTTMWGDIILKDIGKSVIVSQ